MTEPYALGMFVKDGGDRWAGAVRSGRVLPLAGAMAGCPNDLGAILADWCTWSDAIDTAVAKASGDNWQDESGLTACLPYRPENLYGAGANYRKHVIDLIMDSGAGGTGDMNPGKRRAFAEAEMDQRARSGRPFVFMAQRSSIAGPDTPLVLPPEVKQPDWELELAAVIGKPARRVSAQHALDHVAGYTIANDITARDMVSRPDLKALGMNWLASKGPPGFNIIGPYITPARFVPDPQSLHVKLSLNGKVMQDESTSDMIYSVAQIIAYVSEHTTLWPGDIIMTGSPAGNGTHYGRFLQDGDEMRGEIGGLIGAQVVRCVAEDC